VQITCAKVGHRQAPFKQKPSRNAGVLLCAFTRDVKALETLLRRSLVEIWLEPWSFS
jgi:hypothetical protein